MTLTARQLRQPPTIEAIERVPYFADKGNIRSSEASYINGLGSLYRTIPNRKST